MVAGTRVNLHVIPVITSKIFDHCLCQQIWIHSRSKSCPHILAGTRSTVLPCRAAYITLFLFNAVTFFPFRTYPLNSQKAVSSIDGWVLAMHLHSPQVPPSSSTCCAGHPQGMPLHSPKCHIIFDRELLTSSLKRYPMPRSVKMYIGCAGSFQFFVVGR